MPERLRRVDDDGHGFAVERELALGDPIRDEYPRSGTNTL
jgi:hypothetical protein